MLRVGATGTNTHKPGGTYSSHRPLDGCDTSLLISLLCQTNAVTSSHLPSIMLMLLLSSVLPQERARGGAVG